MRFCFSRLDEDGPWDLHKALPEHLPDILRKLGEWEKSTWSEVRHSKNFKDYDMSQCPNKSATDRLAECYGGSDHISRFSFAGRQRLFGFREGADFYIIWWDAKHEVWPSSKKHT